MHFHDFIKFILEFQGISKKPPIERYPSDIRLDGASWDEISRLYKYTSPYNYEYSSSLFWVDGDIIFTKPTQGSKTNVYTRDQLQLKYVPIKQNLFEKQIFINGKLAKKKSVNSYPNNPAITPIFTIHTHPKHSENNRSFYSFFSSTDIQTIFKSPFLCLGLITDRLYLACKHASTPLTISQVYKNTLNQVNSLIVNNTKPSTELIQQLGIVLYTAPFKKKLERI